MDMDLAGESFSDLLTLDDAKLQAFLRGESFSCLQLSRSPLWPDCCKADLINRGRCLFKEAFGKRVAIRFMGSEGWAAGLFLLYIVSLFTSCVGSQVFCISQPFFKPA